jgi:hypothetical protein
MASRLERYFGVSSPLRINFGHKNDQTTVMRYNNLFLMVMLRGRTTAGEFFSVAGNILERRLTKV